MLAALWVEGKEKETPFLDSAGRVRETKGKGGGGEEWSVWVTLPDSLGLRQAGEEGHTSSVAG